MRLTTEIRPTPAGMLSSAKHWNLCCQVQFTHEERAIIEQRGLHDLFLALQPAQPPPGELAYVGVQFIRPGSKLLLIIAGILVVIGFSPSLRGLQTIGGWLLMFGIGAWLFSWWKEYETGQRLTTTEQHVSLGKLLSDPNFSVYAYTQLQADQQEEVKWTRAAGPFLAAAKLEDRLRVVLYQAAKGSVCC